MKKHRQNDPILYGLSGECFLGKYKVYSLNYIYSSLNDVNVADITKGNLKCSCMSWYGILMIPFINYRYLPQRSKLIVPLYRFILGLS